MTVLELIKLLHEQDPTARVIYRGLYDEHDDEIYDCDVDEVEADETKGTVRIR